MIFHLIAKADWDKLPADQPVRVASLESEGFIHATQGEATMLHVANAFYKQQSGEFYLLHIDEARLTSELKWEAPVDPKPAEGQGSGGDMPPEVVAEHGKDLSAQPVNPTTEQPNNLFPHIYGPIDREAIVGMRRAVRGEDGTFIGFAQIDEADPNNPLNLKTPAQLADELLDATDAFSESLKRFKDRVEGRMAEIDEKIKKL
jgi:uncharacterized protein (DUF952 family)